jgi:translation initiation factor IF-3
MPGPHSFRSRPIATNFRFNHQIRISPVRLINQNDEMVGIVPTGEAIKMAIDLGMDLVEVAPTARPPVCKILDYGKFKYQQSKKEDKARAHSKAGRLKEVKIKNVKIGEHDLLIKINHAREFLEEGNKVQFTLQFRGREIAHSELGYDIFKKIKEALFMVSKIEQDARLMGKRINMVLMPDHKDPTKVRPTDGKAAPAAKAAGPMRPATSGSTLNIPVPAPKPATTGSV